MRLQLFPNKSLSAYFSKCILNYSCIRSLHVEIIALCLRIFDSKGYKTTNHSACIYNLVSFLIVFIWCFQLTFVIWSDIKLLDCYIQD